MTLRSVLLSLAALCVALLPAGIQALAATQNSPTTTNPLARRLPPGPFGIPLPATRDPQAWLVWRQRVRAEIRGRGSAPAHGNDAGPGASNGTIETLAGAVPFQKPVKALKTGFGQIHGIVEDSSGNLYIASCDLGVVLKVDSSSNVTIYAGQPLSVGPAISNGDGGPATSARLPCPAGLAVDNANNVYVGDIVARTIRKISAATGTIQTIAGTPGQSGHSGDGGQATSALLQYPVGMAFDDSGNLYIGDLEYVRKMNLASGVIQTVAGNGNQVPQCWLTATNTCPASQVSLTLFGQSIVFTNGRLYAAPDILSVGSATQSGNAVGGIVSIDPSTGVMQLLAGGGYNAGTSTSYPGIGLQLIPQSITADAAGNVYFTGSNQLPNSQTRLYDQQFAESVEELQNADHTIRVLAGVPSPQVDAGDGGPATMAMLRATAGICLSPSGNVVFVDAFDVRSFPVGGNIETIAGNESPNFFGDDGPALQAGLSNPSGVATDSQGNIYVADTVNGRVRRIDAATGIITTVAGGGKLYGTDGDGGPALQAALLPIGIVLDTADRLYVRDSGYGLRTVDLKTGTITTLVANPSMTGAMVFDGNKTLYIACLFPGAGSPLNNEVWAVDITTGTTTVIAGGSYLSPSGDGGPASQAGLYNVQGLALDDQGNLYVADNGFEDIRKVNLSTGIISTLAGLHPGSPYTTGYSGDGGPAIAATFDSPAGLAYDGAGHLIVVDSGNHVLRQIDLTTNTITTVAGDHTQGFGGDGSTPTGAMLYSPLAATFDPTGNLFIADTYNDRVRRVILHPAKLTGVLSFGGGQSPSGDSITFTATYSGLSFGIAPIGTVTFSAGSATLGSGMLVPSTDGNYIATFTATSLPATSANITAQYSGDVHYAAFTTTAPFQPPTPSYTFSANPKSLTIQQGASGSITFTLTPMNGFNQAVSFNCDNTTLPKGVTCTFAPASVTPSGSTPMTSTLTVQTTAATVASDAMPSPLGGLPRGGAALALLLFGISRTRRKAWQSWMSVTLFSVCFAGLVGCGGNSSNGSTKQNANPTPPGAYSIQVAASTGTGASAMTQPVTIAINVTQ